MPRSSRRFDRLEPMTAPGMTAEKKAITASYVPDPTVLSRIEAAAIVFLVAAAMIAAIVLCGWPIPAIGVSLPHGWSVMKANTTLDVLLCSESLALTRPPGNRRRVLAGRACSSVAVLLAAVALFEHAIDWNTGLDTRLAPDVATPTPGRMSIQTASCLGSTHRCQATRAHSAGRNACACQARTRGV